jgi:hypothetical protein
MWRAETDNNFDLMMKISLAWHNHNRPGLAKGQQQPHALACHSILDQLTVQAGS